MCQDIGYSGLGIITNLDEQSVINQLLDNVNTVYPSIEGVWIGLTDEIDEGQWRTYNGQVVNYTNWRFDQPDNLGGQNCATITC